MTATATPLAAAEAAPVRRRRRGPLAVAGAVVLLALVGYVARDAALDRPYDPASAQADGLLGLVRTLEAHGAFVEVSLDPPSDMSTTAFLPVDQLGSRRDAWQRWVERGGRLVVADPGSPLHGFEVRAGGFVDAVGPTTRTPGCGELDRVDAVTHAGWAGYVVAGPATLGCFPLADGVAWLATRAEGAGEVVALGSPEPFANGMLDRDDNVVLAATLLAPGPGDRVVIVPRGEVGDGEAGLVDLIPPRVWYGLGLLGLAALLGVVATGRRLGRPVAERLPPVLPASELAHSLGGLLQRTGRPRDAAATLRRRARREVAAATVGGAGLPPETLVRLAVDRLGVDPATAETALLDAPVPDDRTLLEVQAAVRDVLARRRTAAT